MQIFLSAGFILLVVLWGIVAPDNMAAVFDTLLAAVTHNFGWLYLWVVLGLVV
jgi:glycine betaine transporter